MVACKSRVRERWRQILEEADRIREKYLLTVDEDLSDDVLRSMRKAGLRTFVPQDVIAQHYALGGSARPVESVGTLVAALKAIL
jgi:hypothetical protein